MIRLLPEVFKPLPTREIKPQGWLLRQLRAQADGLSGHLDEFWPDVRDSQWFGGEAEGWERAPYWLDGLIPLAYLLDEPVLIRKVHKYMGFILDHQQQSGWLGPVVKDAGTDEPVVPAGYDLWAELLVYKVLVEYHQATGDESILVALERSLRFFDRLIDTWPLFNWGHFRWFEGLIAIFYLYEHKPQEWLLNLAVKIHAQGFHWGDFFKHWPCKDATPAGRWSYMSHVVNNAMAVKAHALWRRLSQDEQDKTAVYNMLSNLERYHGMVTGVFTGDECLAGKRPTQGTELCAVNEYAYSLEWLVGLLGDASLGDRLESVIYNALPATFSPDMWTHQYDQQVNQIECSIHANRTWNTNGPDANLFGLEPNFGCCTANLSQGWPKFAARLWMRSNDNGLAAVSYAPCKVITKIDTVSVSIEVETDYPFNDEITIRLHVSAPIAFPLYFRIPTWVNDGRIEVGSGRFSAQPGSFQRIFQEWNGVTVIHLTFPMSPRLVDGYGSAKAVVRGPLVYALKIEEGWCQINKETPGREYPHADYEVFSRSDWNYGLLLTPRHLDEQIVFTNNPLGKLVFSPDQPPVIGEVLGKRVPGWTIRNGSAEDVPDSPLRSDQPIESVHLIPYGCTNLRITEFPLIEN